jgi:hypothetical protein
MLTDANSVVLIGRAPRCRFTGRRDFGAELPEYVLGGRG